MNKSGADANQGGDGTTNRMGKTGQNEDQDIDEKTNVDQRSGDYQGGAQRQAAGQNSQQDHTGTRRDVENSAGGRQQRFGADNDQGTEADNNKQGGRMDQADKNGQQGAESNKDSNRSTDNKSNQGR